MSPTEPTDPNRDLPPGVPPPPPPRPDLKDIREVGPSYRNEPGKRRQKKKKKDRSHPTDAYPPLKTKGSCGCGGCFGGAALALILVLGGLAASIGWYGPGRFVSRGYEVVNAGPDAVIEVAPTQATVYLSQGKIDWQVPVTTVPVALIAREIHVVGDFHDEASLTAVKATATERARFAKNLEVRALEFTDLGLTLKGELRGRVMKNLP